VCISKPTWWTALFVLQINWKGIETLRTTNIENMEEAHHLFQHSPSHSVTTASVLNSGSIAQKYRKAIEEKVMNKAHNPEEWFRKTPRNEQLMILLDSFQVLWFQAISGSTLETIWDSLYQTLIGSNIWQSSGTLCRQNSEFHRWLMQRLPGTWKLTCSRAWTSASEDFYFALYKCAHYYYYYYYYLTIPCYSRWP